KFKEGVAISGAPFFAYFLWQDKESRSAPAGDETQDAPPRPNPAGAKKTNKTNHQDKKCYVFPATSPPASHTP
ncbi:hypothetical protein ACQCR7_25245, partial [Ralstonia pseudosolanacearum]|uniref:hypothetical protein n=1 Tax=Ralstonia pseudosolanacearum TaxID=1310165 RepID=UPI003CF2CB6B